MENNKRSAMSKLDNSSREFSQSLFKENIQGHLGKHQLWLGFCYASAVWLPQHTSHVLCDFYVTNTIEMKNNV